MQRYRRGVRVRRVLRVPGPAWPQGWFCLRRLQERIPPEREHARRTGPALLQPAGCCRRRRPSAQTSLVATLGRALSARGERVLLVDTAAFGLLPFFFGARDQRPGVLRTFTPPGVSGAAPIQMLTIDPDTLGPDNSPHQTLPHEISR